jgi:HSP20 family protein
MFSQANPFDTLFGGLQGFGDRRFGQMGQMGQMGGMPTRAHDLTCDICGVPGAEPFLLTGGVPQQSLTLWVDVFDSPNHYSLVADVPGISKNDVNITLEEDNILKIKIDRLFPRIEGGVLLKEREFGRFLRWLRLPRNVDTTKMSAKVDNGQLTISIPKKPVQERERLPQGQQLQITGPSPSSSFEPQKDKEQQYQQQPSPKTQALQEQEQPSGFQKGQQQQQGPLGDVPPLSKQGQQEQQFLGLGVRQPSCEQPPQPLPQKDKETEKEKQKEKEKCPSTAVCQREEMAGQMGVSRSPPLQAEMPQPQPLPQKEKEKEKEKEKQKYPSTAVFQREQMAGQMGVPWSLPLQPEMPQPQPQPQPPQKAQVPQQPQLGAQQSLGQQGRTRHVFIK